MVQEQLKPLAVAWYSCMDVATWHRANEERKITPQLVPDNWAIRKEPITVSGSQVDPDSDPEDIKGWDWIWKYGEDGDTWADCCRKAKENKKRTAEEIEELHYQSLNKRQKSNYRWVAKEQNYGYPFFEPWQGSDHIHGGHVANCAEAASSSSAAAMNPSSQTLV